MNKRRIMWKKPESVVTPTVEDAPEIVAESPIEVDTLPVQEPVLESPPTQEIEDAPEIVQEPVLESPPTREIEVPVATSQERPRRNGNGHTARRIRAMSIQEKGVIKTEFINRNGTPNDDHWVRFKGNLSDEITIFQITGYVSHLHRLVAQGQLRLSDIRAYEAFMQTKRNLWATYNSPKYRAMRHEEVLPEPVFTSPVGRRAYV